MITYNKPGHHKEGDQPGLAVVSNKDKMMAYI